MNFLDKMERKYGDVYKRQSLSSETLAVSLRKNMIQVI